MCNVVFILGGFFFCSFLSSFQVYKFRKLNSHQSTFYKDSLERKEKRTRRLHGKQRPGQDKTINSQNKVSWFPKCHNSCKPRRSFSLGCLLSLQQSRSPLSSQQNQRLSGQHEPWGSLGWLALGGLSEASSKLQVSHQQPILHLHIESHAALPVSNALTSSKLFNKEHGTHAH